MQGVQSGGESVRGRIRMTDDEIYALPVVMTFKQAARAHRIGTKLALKMKADGMLPFPIRPQGRSWVTTRAQLLESLGLPLRPAPTADATDSPAA